MAIQSGRSYRIVNAKSGTLLDLSGTDGVTISGFNSNGGDNQKWYLEQSDGHWTFRCGTGKYLGINGNVEDGTPVVGVSNPVQWDIWPDEEDSNLHRIFVPGSQNPMNIDLSDHGNSANGTKIQLWYKWEGKNQAWRFEEA
ncbi:hypothetical protein VNI00_013972 [Paramarasmius palmivorus]|uniref:Ricin B lectin domain-containing protein n=1 Tax=Paramarasmius palmivorus TaxID=297713 RepID=A0AAW0BXW5_9AGAR